MSFHDNAIDPIFGSFSDYVTANLVGDKWKGPYRYLDTSGADASLFLCPEERYHVNNNYDQSASRVLYSLQYPVLNGGTVSFIEKYGVSYADALHNGAIAAAYYLTEASVFSPSSFHFGRKDACHLPPGRVDFDNAKASYGDHNIFALCGPTEILPNLVMEAEELSEWFHSRGMTDCNWLALMWTHTLMVSMMYIHTYKLIQ
jgi:hypothetical protein